MDLGVPDWRNRVGDTGQVARADSFVVADGPSRGARLLRMVSGGGVEIDVHPDRCLDIGQVTWNGMPLAWITPAGFTPSWTQDHTDTGWLRGFGGGLVATCGLDSFGVPSTCGGQNYGLHGRIGASPATVTAFDVTETAVVLRGRVRQSALFAETMTLDRTIEMPLGGQSFTLMDRVTNDGMDEQPHMILYHCNLGWPLLDDGARITGSMVATSPRDEDAKEGLADWDQIGPPQDTYPEQVFHHDVDGPAFVRLENTTLGKWLQIDFDGDALPVLYQWKMLRKKHYVLGLEPANCAGVHGRVATRDAGNMPVLAPGESHTYSLTFSMGTL